MAEDTRSAGPTTRTAPSAKSALWPFKFLGWVAGGLSVVNLTKDLDWYTLQGSIAQWVDTYGRLVADLRTLLFGWIHVSWMPVSQLEAHGLVLCALLGSSTARGVIASLGRSRDAQPGFTLSLYAGLIGWAVPMAIASFLALVLPGEWGLWVPIAFIVLICLVFGIAIYEGEGEEFGPRFYWPAFGLNLIGVTGIALVVVLVGTFVRLPV